MAICKKYDILEISNTYEFNGGFMFKKMKIITVGMLALLGLNFSQIEAGAILKLYEANCPGKQIIIFGEQHEGEIEIVGGEPIPVEDVEQNQHGALIKLFSNDFGPKRNSIAIYLECNDDLCESLKDRMIEKLETGKIEQVEEHLNQSWFDHYYRLFYAMGTVGSNDVASIKNFDGRSKLGIALLFRSIKLSEIASEYIAGNFDKSYLDSEKAKFFESVEYKIFKDNEENWLETLVQPIIATATRLKTKVTPEVSEQMFASIYRYAQMLYVLKSKAEFLNQDIFQFLFSALEFTKGRFPKLLSDICGIEASEEIQPWDAFDLINLGTDLNLIEKVINDPHKIVLVHCGKQHAENVYNYFEMMEEFGVQTRSTSLLAPLPFLLTSEETYEIMHDFISN